ncbi:hypothetical protein AZE42_13583 [Rhizopogon vesiculosus]|uniref:RNase H type-1 domain-containing protein n=1 Tax=Rhizopogon vesiculosus TaxID=180088 RepID=A0A1J8QVY7_9AGAM|nr:hypothetical protein AZE42_13583 [Rhizopogon vesiculosus]
MDILHDDLRRLILAHDQRKLIVRWSPGHQSIPGNEAADEQVKLAAGGDNSEARLLPSKSALKQQFHHKIKKGAAAVMTRSPRYPLLRKIDSSAPSKHFSLLVAGIPRRLIPFVPGTRHRSRVIEQTPASHRGSSQPPPVNTATRGKKPFTTSSSFTPFTHDNATSYKKR